ncbi:hypothetical protein ASG16_019280 [Brevibacillus sp. Leaf182]|nr:hypothetical protein ASG16_019280 [Brevibacillus sp. Leaf182]
MNKRLRKKIHKQLLVDICFEISVSAYWRKKLKHTPFHVPIIINVSNSMYLPSELCQKIRQSNLKYFVKKLPYLFTHDFGYYPDNYVFFCFTPLEFPRVKQLSVNNPATM